MDQCQQTAGGVQHTDFPLKQEVQAVAIIATHVIAGRWTQIDGVVGIAQLANLGFGQYPQYRVVTDHCLHLLNRGSRLHAFVDGRPLVRCAL